MSLASIALKQISSKVVLKLKVINDSDNINDHNYPKRGKKKQNK